jgi:spoIIIJ-associated protein
MQYQALINQFFSYFGLTEDQIHIAEDQGMIIITLDVPETESGRFIGRYATTLDSLQLILSLMINNGQETHHHVSVDVGGYRAERQGVLGSMAERLSAAVLESNTPHAFPPLSSTDRRAIHLLFQDHETLTTYSEGEGQNRRLILAPKS